MPRKEDTPTPESLDPATLDRMREATADILAAAPEGFDTNLMESAAIRAADLYIPPSGADVNDPEDLTALLNAAFRASGMAVPEKLLLAAKAAQNPIRPVGTDREQVEVLPQEDEIQRQARVYEKYQKSVTQGSSKRSTMLAAIQASPAVSYLNRHDRWLQINGVKVTVPEGAVKIPKIIADFCDDQDAHEQWAANYKREAQKFLNIERTTSFVTNKVEAYSVY